MSLIVLDKELTEKNIIKELGLFIDGSLQGFSFCPLKTFKSNKHTTRNTSHLHRIAWSSGKLDYEKLFAVSYDIKIMNAEVFAIGPEKCRLLTNLLGRNVEKLDDYGCPKFKILSKRTVRGSALVTLSDTKQGFTGPRGKQRCTENGLCNIFKLLYVFIVFVFTTSLIISTRHDLFYSIKFEILSLRNRRLIKKITLIRVKLSLTKTIKKGNLGPVWDKPVPDR